MSNNKYNARSPAVKRIMQEMKELQEDSSMEYVAEALEDNIFEWYFVIRGPTDTEFEGGLYHGRIVLPAEYPFKPPSFIMLTPNGRFAVGVKICLSISERHPEEWQPSWSLRTALTALIAFLPTPGKGALGSLDFPKEDRKQLALKSRQGTPKFNNEERQSLIDQLHQKMLDREMQTGGQIPHKHEQDFRLLKKEYINQPQQSSQPEQSQIGQQSNSNVNTSSRLPTQLCETNARNSINTNSRVQNGRDSSKAVVVALVVAICALLAKKLGQYVGYNVLQL